jgi:hypothetical protein
LRPIGDLNIAGNEVSNQGGTSFEPNPLPSCHTASFKETCIEVRYSATLLRPAGRLPDLSKKASRNIIFLEAFYIYVFGNRFCITRLAGLALIA